jgi:4-hydroxy-tetrahydrodipicolinate reductase
MGRWVSQLISTDYASQTKLAAQAHRGMWLEPLLAADAIIDFSSPDGSAQLAELALKSGDRLPVFIIGSTGWKPEQLKSIEALAAKTPVVLSSNFSTGVLALQRMLKTFAPLLTRLGYQPVMVETHHQHKKDAPSGTAIMLNKAIESSTGVGPVQTHSIRSGEVIGDHEVTFYGAADRIVFGHMAQDRSVFARGALDAAIWAASRRDELSSLKTIISMDRYFDELIRS